MTNSNICPVAQSIAIHCDEPDQRAISEILSELIGESNQTHIDGELVELYEITDSIDDGDLKEAIEQSVCGNSLAIYELYIKALGDYING